MAEKEQILKEKLEHTGIFDFKAMYSYAHNWFKEEEFVVTEEEYKEKSSGDSRDLQIKWKVFKELSDYFSIEYKVLFRIEGMKDVEVEIDGQKRQMNQGKVETEITGVLVMDTDGKWETSAWNRFMRDVYNKYLVPNRVLSMRIKVSEKAQSFKEDLKSFLNLTARR
ncbi:MAG: hypothetical protein ABH864_00230 [archaeon]